MAHITTRPVDLMLKNVIQLKAKVAELETYANNLSEAEYQKQYVERAPAREEKKGEPVRVDAWLNIPLRDRKKFILIEIVDAINTTIRSHYREGQHYNVTPEDWSQLQKDLINVVDEIPVARIEKLAEHRYAFIRWVKEFFAMLGTGVVPWLVVTACNAYKAEKGTFSFSRSGFFANTDCVDKLNSVYNLLEPEKTRELMAEDGYETPSP